jgi:antitoxin MazE
MQTTIQQWGNSLALRIPKAFAHQTSIKKGSAVSLSLENGRMVVKPLRPRKYSLKELVSKITPQNRHPETDWGKPMGKEVW